ncbi:MAG TPA: VWA domain-containing protein [Terriglobales bacterium]|nr:VWA domain-containing protein [Terriglobales bacterium]
MLFRHCRLLIFLAPFAIAFLMSPIARAQVLPQSETIAPAAANQPTFQSKVRVVLVDIVVTKGKGDSAGGLRKQDFKVLEDGKPQKISFFEEHKGVATTQVKLPPMPTGVYTNFPTTKSADSVNVLLLDSLNTEPRDQVFVHKQMIKYLQNVPPGTRLGIFTLGSRLRMIKGISADSSGMLAALDQKGAKADPQYSRLNPTAFQKDTDKEIVNAMEMNQASPEAIDALKEFQSENLAYLTDARVRITMQAFQELARYLSNIPGRKNVIWVSGSFPISVFPQANMPRQYQAAIQQTADLLTADQVAVYPIAAQGLLADARYDANLFHSPSIPEGNSERSLQQLSMNKLAQDTGGQAFFNTNGLASAVSNAINDGSHYYTVTYTPTNKTMDGKFRRIQVKLAKGDYKLSYRRGYYAEDPKARQIASDRQPTMDPLLPLVGFGMPDFSQIIYKIRVLPVHPQPAPDAPIIGGNVDMKKPFTRYGVDFAVALDDLKLQLAPDGVRRGSIELILVAYNADGKPLNMVTQESDVLLKPKVYASMQKVGLQIHKEIDVPSSEVFLRTGIYDRNASNAGTLGITLDSPVITTSETHRAR